MSMLSHEPQVTETISEEQALAIFDSTARHYTGMSGLEFLEAWSSGKFGPDPDSQPGVMEVASLIPILAR